MQLIKTVLVSVKFHLFVKSKILVKNQPQDHRDVTDTFQRVNATSLSLTLCAKRSTVQKSAIHLSGITASGEMTSSSVSLDEFTFQLLNLVCQVSLDSCHQLDNLC